MSWKDRSACGPETAHLFFPTHGPGLSTLTQGREAKAICANCPVFDECRDESLSSDLGVRLDGIWAGLTRDERKQLHRDQMRREAVRNVA